VCLKASLTLNRKLRQHTPAYVSIQHTSAYVSIRHHTPARGALIKAPLVAAGESVAKMRRGFRARVEGGARRRIRLSTDERVYIYIYIYIYIYVYICNFLKSNFLTSPCHCSFSYIYIYIHIYIYIYCAKKSKVFVTTRTRTHACRCAEQKTLIVCVCVCVYQKSVLYAGMRPEIADS